MNSMRLISNGETFDVRRQDSGLYQVLSGDRFLGFVERAGNVYVALVGTHYDLAVETGQALSLGRAAALLKAPTSQAPSGQAPASQVSPAMRSVA
jgi:hypothetical protein